MTVLSSNFSFTQTNILGNFAPNLDFGRLRCQVQKRRTAKLRSAHSKRNFCDHACSMPTIQTHIRQCGRNRVSEFADLCGGHQDCIWRARRLVIQCVYLILPTVKYSHVANFDCYILTFTAPEVEAMHDVIIVVLCVMLLSVLIELFRNFAYQILPTKWVRRLPSWLLKPHHHQYNTSEDHGIFRLGNDGKGTLSSLKN